MSPTSCYTAYCIFTASFEAITFVLGIVGNGVVLWIAGFKMKKSVNAIWYLSLAVSDFLYCSTAFFSFVYMVKEDWVFGRVMCRLMYFLISLNLFSSIFLLVTISIDRCVVVMFTVCAQNKRSTAKAYVVVLVVYILSASFSLPEAIFPETLSHYNQTFCILKHQNIDIIPSLWLNFIVGFVIPFLIITVCYLVIIRKVGRQTSRKPLKVVIVVISAFFICWMPYHVVTLVSVYSGKQIPMIVVAVTQALVKTNSFLNPFLYAFMGREFKTQCFMSVSHIQRAIGD